MVLSEYKFRKSLDDTDLPTFLRELADWIENGCEGDNFACSFDIDATDFHKLKLGFKRREGSIELKMKVKTPREEAADTFTSQQRVPVEEETERSSRETSTAPAEPKRTAPAPKPTKKRLPNYKQLKKRMKATFKALYLAARASALPSKEIHDSFVEDSRLMIQYPGKGDPMYDEYNKAIDDLEQAYANGNISGYAEAVEQLNTLKTDGHAEYK